MDRPMSKEESYADRRQLFKSIWDTATKMDITEADVADKNDNAKAKSLKIIRTLRLNEVDRCLVGKRKKQRIKNLRAVCTKVLDFCDKQDADDTKYEHMVRERQIQTQPPIEIKEVKEKKKRLKRRFAKKKVKKTKSLHSPFDDASNDDGLFLKVPDKQFVETNLSHKMRPLTVTKRAHNPDQLDQNDAKMSLVIQNELKPKPQRKKALKSKTKRKTVSLSESLPTGHATTHYKSNYKRGTVAVHTISF